MRYRALQVQYPAGALYGMTHEALSRIVGNGCFSKVAHNVTCSDGPYSPSSLLEDTVRGQLLTPFISA